MGAQCRANIYTASHTHTQSHKGPGSMHLYTYKIQAHFEIGSITITEENIGRVHSTFMELKKRRQNFEPSVQLCLSFVHFSHSANNS